MRFAKLNDETLEKLSRVEVGQIFISIEAEEEIVNILRLNSKTPDELTAIRNTVVKEMNERYIDKAEKEKNIEAFFKYNAVVSGTVAVIDKKLFELGELL